MMIRHLLCALLMSFVLFFSGFFGFLKSEINHWEMLKQKNMRLYQKNRVSNVSKINIVNEVLRIASEQQVTIVQIPVVKNHRINFIVKGSLIGLANFISAIKFLLMDNYFLTLKDGRDLRLEVKSRFVVDVSGNKEPIVSAKNLGNLFVTSTSIKKYEFNEYAPDPSLLNAISIKQLRVVGHVVLNKMLWILLAFPDGLTVLVRAGSFVGLEHAQIINESEMILQGHKQPLFV